MIQYKITATCEDEFERDAIIHAVTNKMLLTGLYQDVFRKHIKYEDNPATTWTEVWKEVNEYLEERK